jgi:DNA-binding winged helix-turn-helix (wHTH) protein
MAASASAFPTRYVRFGAFQLDTERQDLLKNGARLRLPGKVCQVLTTLLERPGEIVTREELRARLWPSDTHVNFDANVNTTVNKLRQILCSSDSDASGFGAAGKPRGANGSAAAGEPDDSVYVQTIPRKGYSFVSKVEFVDRVDSAGAPGDSAEAAEENSDATGSVESSKILGAPTSRFFAAHRAPVLFTAGVIALVVAAMLFGAAITLFANRGF